MSRRSLGVAGLARATGAWSAAAPSAGPRLRCASPPRLRAVCSGAWARGVGAEHWPLSMWQTSEHIRRRDEAEQAARDEADKARPLLERAALPKPFGRQDDVAAIAAAVGWNGQTALHEAVRPRAHDSPPRTLGRAARIRRAPSPLHAPEDVTVAACR